MKNAIVEDYFWNLLITPNAHQNNAHWEKTECFDKLYSILLHFSKQKDDLVTINHELA